MSHHSPIPPPSQVVYPVKAVLRTTVQIVLGLVVMMPYLITELGLNKSWPIVVGVLGVSAGITRVMAIPAVNLLLAKYVGLGAVPAYPDERD